MRIVKLLLVFFVVVVGVSYVLFQFVSHKMCVLCMRATKCVRLFYFSFGFYLLD